MEARFLVLLLALFAFRGFSVLPTTASLNALAALETISVPASTVAFAASVITRQHYDSSSSVSTAGDVR